MPDGSFGTGFSKLIANLNKLAEVPSQVAREAAADIQESIENQFDDGCDPYGVPWAALAPSTIKRGRFPPPLTDYGYLRESIEVRPSSGSGIQIDVGEEYAIFHQKGTARMPARPILPEADMPLTWVTAIEDATENALKRRLGK